MTPRCMMPDHDPKPRTAKTDAPVHDIEQVAIALHYDQAADAAPRIVAAGHGAIAEHILALAFANGVKVREDADLAEILAAVEVDAEIPLEAFTAVAEILAYVHRANGRPIAAAQGPEATP